MQNSGHIFYMTCMELPDCRKYNNILKPIRDYTNSILYHVSWNNEIEYSEKTQGYSFLNQYTSDSNIPLL